MKVLVHRTRDWLSRRDALVLAGMFTVVLGTALFFAFANEVLEGDTQKFDERMVSALRDPADLSRGRGPDWFSGMVRDITALGSIAVVGLLALVVLGFAALRRNLRLTLLMLGAAGGGFLLNNVLKELIDRPRPALPHVAALRSRSFPSGHAMVSASVYLSLAAVLATREKRRLAKAYILGVGLLLTLLVGLSRVYLGYHYPTDVLAGWLAGLIWAVLFALITRAMFGAHAAPEA